MGFGEEVSEEGVEVSLEGGGIEAVVVDFFDGMVEGEGMRERPDEIFLI